MDLEEQIVAVFDHYGLATPRSGEQPIHCPVHDDAHKSASVNRDKGVWFCHACGEGGTALRIVMLREGIEQGPAAKFIANLTGKEFTPFTVKRGSRNKRWIPPMLRGVS